jgi:glutamate dehydrogenase (NAD(P)+)
MGKRFEQKSFENMLGVIEQATGQQLSLPERAAIARGADETDIVNSGLEETMVNAYQQIHQIWKSDPKVETLRTAAFISAINKIALAYMELGIFP